MTIEQFNLLSNTQKENAISNNGIFLENYDEGNKQCDVYKLFEFYVAFCYEIGKNEPAQITTRASTDELPNLIKIPAVL